LPNATQNQVAARSCWFESGQGHHPLLPILASSS
jgi:hypothetical protein